MTDNVIAKGHKPQLLKVRRGSGFRPDNLKVVCGQRHCEKDRRSTKQSIKVTKNGLPRPLRGLAMTEKLSKTRFTF